MTTTARILRDNDDMTTQLQQSKNGGKMKMSWQREHDMATGGESPYSHKRLRNTPPPYAEKIGVDIEVPKQPGQQQNIIPPRHGTYNSYINEAHLFLTLKARYVPTQTSEHPPPYTAAAQTSS